MDGHIFLGYFKMTVESALNMMLCFRVADTPTMLQTRLCPNWLKWWKRRTRQEWLSKLSRYTLMIIKTYTSQRLWHFNFVIRCKVLVGLCVCRWRTTCGCLWTVWLRTPALTLRPKKTWHYSRRISVPPALWVTSLLNRWEMWLLNHLELPEPCCMKSWDSWSACYLD